MDRRESFDIREFERENSYATPTAWASQISKFKGRRTYGRRGSDAVANNKTIRKNSCEFPLSDAACPSVLENKEREQETDEEVDTEVEDNDSWSMITSPNNKDSRIDTPPSRKIRKWNTMTGASPTPSQPPKLMRSQSVSTMMPPWKLSSVSRAVSSSFTSLPVEGEGNCENYNPNFFTGHGRGRGRNFSEESTSPKRSAVAEVNKKGRKKCKPTNHPFMQNNDFGALDTINNDDNKHSEKNVCSKKSKALGSDTFSDLARNHGEVAPAWTMSSTISCPGYWSENKEDVNRRRSLSADLFSPATYSFHDETMDGTDSVSSPTMSTTSATRKRGVYKSRFLSDESPVLRSRSRMLSPSPVRTPDISCLMDSNGSKHRTASKLMNISFLATKTGDGKTIDRTYLDVAMSDDDLNVSGDSDISADSEDELMGICSSTNFHDLERPSSTRSSRMFELEKATVDDIVKHMPSYEDIQFLSTSLQQNFEGQGGCLSWNIAPPVVWAAKRRDAFFQATRILGFTFRAGGGNVSYIQISKTRGSMLLSLLNSTLETYDERKERQRLLHAEKNVSPREFVFPSNSKTNSQAGKSMKLTPTELTSSSWWSKSADRTTEELSQIMGKLNVNAKPSIQNDDNEDCVFNVNDCFDSRDSHDHAANCIPRKSLECHSSSTDLNAQMHGTTPVHSRLMGRPPRMSLQSLSSKTTVSTNIDSQSPFFPNSDLSKPVPISTQVNCATTEFVLTPLIGRQDAWGSRPKNGCDWGTSESGEDDIIEKAFHKFSNARKQAGFNEGSEQIVSGDVLGSSCLGLDFEAASQYRDDFESPTSFSSPGDTGIDESLSSCRGLYLSGHENFVSEKPNGPFVSRAVRRRQTAFAKHKRMSLFASAVNPMQTFAKQRKSLFVQQSCMLSARKQKIFVDSAPEFFKEYNSVMNDFTGESSSTYKASPLADSDVLRMVFDFLDENELLFVAGLVSRKWSDAATHAHANLMLSSVNCSHTEKMNDNDNPITSQRSWEYLMTAFPWACFLSEGAFKRVYKVFNHKCQEEEAISVMDVKQIHSTGNINVVGAELAVSVLLSSLVRRGICPNFVATRGMFSCQYEPPDNHWGTATNKRPKGADYSESKTHRRPREPKDTGHFQYIRMELCGEGDAEEFLKRQPNESLLPVQARNLLFQISFALYAAAEKFSLKHYDVKLLNVFLQRMPAKNGSDVILRYGLGEHTFALQSLREDAIIAKLADYGTANVDCVTNGQNVTIAQFTTLENTPPDYFILGDQALQGHGHDCFGLGLCMLHLFTGHAPYEEILEHVVCPSNLKKELRRIWENEEETQFSVIRSIVLADVYKDEDGNVIEGDADETLYDTLYKYLVLFGIPDESTSLLNSKVMAAVKTTLLSEGRQKKTRGRNRKILGDANKFISDRNKYSLSHGNNQYISRARTSLSAMDGGMDLLMSLVRFNPQNRASALDVLNSAFMAPLREIPNDDRHYNDHDEVLSFTAFST